jgi:hypothetical protein
MKNKLPAGWTESKIKGVIDYYESQTEEEAIAEDEAVLAIEETLMQVPLELVADIRALIAKQQANH